MNHFYQISIRATPGVTADQIQKKIDVAPDWYRFGDGRWIVWTPATSKSWYDWLEPLIKPSGRITIFRLDMDDYFGYSDNSLWDWLKKSRAD
jgi:hypothetical protein